MIVTTKRDLKTWVSDAFSAPGDLDDDEADAIVAEILSRHGCPRFGTDWREFLDRLDVLAIRETLASE